MSDRQAGYSAPAGMRDLLPEQTAVFQTIEAAAREVFRRYGFDEVRTPVVEHTEVFARGVGEGTDIVQKEMYTFLDRSDPPHSLTLRPEGTAGAARALVEHSIPASDPLTRWYYVGPMLRYERMQKGRYRHFFQIGAEAYGSPGPQIDAEIIDLLRAFFMEIGLVNLTFRVNSLGDSACRPKYAEALVAYFRSHAAELCDDCKGRLDRNPLRILDCKKPGCQAVAAAAPSTLDFLCDPCKAHFEELKTLLKALEIPHQIDPRIVRGLDYYTRTVFEVLAGDDGTLGSQNAVCGGGRYDELVKQFGGPDVPAVGFAVGVDRLAMLAADKLPPPKPPDLFIAAIGEVARRESFRIAQRLRGAGAAVDLDERGGSVKSQLRRADKRKARYAFVLGENELGSGTVKLKRMADGTEREVPLTELASAVRE